MANTLIYEQLTDKLEPYLAPRDARTLAIQMAASKTILKGTVLGQISASGKYDAFASPNRVQTITIAGTLSAGTWRIYGRDKDGKFFVTDALAYNASASDIATALNAQLGTSAVAVAVAVDYATGIVVTFSGTGYAALRQELLAVDISALTGATTANIDDTTSDTGVETAAGIAVCDMVTDSNGIVYLGTSVTASPTLINTGFQTGLMYWKGNFKLSDLVGWNAAAAADLKAVQRGTSGYEWIHIP